MDKPVVIVGAGPAGLATSACLNLLSIPNTLLEREDSYASLWTKKSYDRLNLHLRKQFCQLPHLTFPSTSPHYIPKQDFIQYLEDYVAQFEIKPVCRRSVESATYDEAVGKWSVSARNTVTGDVEVYNARFLVVATGENSDAYVPEIHGLETFGGEVMHSSEYKSGLGYDGKAVLVVGCGNSGMEIALDLCNYGAKTSIVVRSPVHVLTRDMMYLGSVLFKLLPPNLVDSFLVMLSKLKYGDMTKYGFSRPKEGIGYLKSKYGKYPVIDVGTWKKITSGEIQVLPSVTSIKGNEVVFSNGKMHQFEAIVFATGYKRSTSAWLKDDDYLLDKDGLSKQRFPNHWKGHKGLYCAGFARRGLYGAAMDAENIANDINLKINDPNAQTNTH
eukprot:TRINITY_DN112_c0_g1_i1.p1 TRINITY_DN112_c0_g1~~TRINITY_DN112_c0_g1_i1.p1  ORF type:complete len:387 (-),score=40.48 TRINITY_DN112_c0_g1_i1:117-1277(-)